MRHDLLPCTAHVIVGESVVVDYSTPVPAQLQAAHCSELEGVDDEKESLRYFEQLLKSKRQGKWLIPLTLIYPSERLTPLQAAKLAPWNDLVVPDIPTGLAFCARYWKFNQVDDVNMWSMEVAIPELHRLGLPELPDWHHMFSINYCGDDPGYAHVMGDGPDSPGGCETWYLFEAEGAHQI